MQAKDLMDELNQLANPVDAQFLHRYFKTGKGEYGEGDIFLGIRVPITRKICKKYQDLDTKQIEKLLKSPIHEHRLGGVIIMTNQVRSKNCDEKKRKQLFDLYLSKTNRINNWDIVDISSIEVIGGYLTDKDRSILYELVKSKNLWERRIAIISTAKFIDNYQFDDTLKIAKLLINDDEDLIHKATGWMLREVGKKNVNTLIVYLNKNYQKMPRTMLRYSIEKLPESIRKAYLKK